MKRLLMFARCIAVWGFLSAVACADGSGVGGAASVSPSASEQASDCRTEVVDASTGAAASREQQLRAALVGIYAHAYRLKNPDSPFQPIPIELATKILHDDAACQIHAGGDLGAANARIWRASGALARVWEPAAASSRVRSALDTMLSQDIVERAAQALLSFNPQTSDATIRPTPSSPADTATDSGAAGVPSASAAAGNDGFGGDPDADDKQSRMLAYLQRETKFKPKCKSCLLEYATKQGSAASPGMFYYKAKVKGRSEKRMREVADPQKWASCNSSFFEHSYVVDQPRVCPASGSAAPPEKTPAPDLGSPWNGYLYEHFVTSFCKLVGGGTDCETVGGSIALYRYEFRNILKIGPRTVGLAKVVDYGLRCSIDNVVESSSPTPGGIEEDCGYIRVRDESTGNPSNNAIVDAVKYLKYEDPRMVTIMNATLLAAIYEAVDVSLCCDFPGSVPDRECSLTSPTPRAPTLASRLCK